MSLVSLSNSTTTNNNTGTLTTKTTNHQRHSSSTFIAHLLLQEHPPKVQPRSSSARDKALFSHLDRVDAEAGCILIALANHDKRKDMNDLIPYSIRVIDYNQITPIETMESTHGDNNSSINSSNSSTSDSASPHTDNEDPTTTTTTTTTTVKDENDNNTTMSITNLIGSMPSSTDDDPALSAMTYQYTNTNNQQASTTVNSMPSLTETTMVANDKHTHDLKPSSWNRKSKTDPILLLAAAAKAIDQDEQLQQRANQKRKYSDDDSSLDSPAGRPRMEQSQAVVDQRQSEKSKFSYQYLSMKQNPKIKRNAMHAYITYMIYTDLASSEKMYQHDKGNFYHQQQNEGISATGPPSLLPPASVTTPYAPPSSSPRPTSNHRSVATASPSSASALATTTTTTSSSPSSSLAYEHQYPKHTHPKYHNYTSRINIPASGTTGTNASSSETHPTTFNSTWPYVSTTTPPPPPPPSSSSAATSIPSSPPSLLHSGSSSSSSSSIMARPLTAFLRDDMYGR